MADAPLVYVVIVNWNGWRHTIECLESVFRMDYPRFRVIVCDNGSEDGSLHRIKDWADGRLESQVATECALRGYSVPPVRKPIPYAVCRRDEADAGDPGEAPLMLIDAGANLGFAGGNNIALRYILSRGDEGFVWLLNNDTIATPNALGLMLERMAETPDAGICGATLLYYDRPDTVQALGGAVYNRWLGVPTHIGVFDRLDAVRVSAQEVERRMSYVVGASMLVSRAFLDKVGLMTEDCFLCGEEIDWALRGKRYFGLAYAPKAVIYHKEGAALGSSSDPKARSRIADYYSLRSRIIIARRHAPWALPTVYLGLLGSALIRAGRGQWDRAAMILRTMMNLPCDH